MKRLAPILGALVALICGREGCAGDDAMSKQQTQQQQQQCPETGSCDINLEDTEAVGVDAAMDVAVGEVPVIDISALMSPDLRSKSDWDEAAAAVARACEQWGFFQVWTCYCCLLYFSIIYSEEDGCNSPAASPTAVVAGRAAVKRQALL